MFSGAVEVGEKKRVLGFSAVSGACNVAVAQKNAKSNTKLVPGARHEWYNKSQQQR